jgi:mannosyltransferase OCH1-like enzyme
MVALGVLAMYVVFAASWDALHTADPCDVALATKEELSRLPLQGRSKDREGFPSDWEPELPKIIHHQWKDEHIPEKYQSWHKAWFEHFPESEYTHMLWTDESGRNLIKEHYPWFLETYDNYQYEIKRADAVRYFFLYHYGGIHTDLDYEPMTNFYKHLPQDRVGLVESPYQYNELTQNSLMSSPRGDPFWLTVFTEMIKNQDKAVLVATGPKLLDMVMRTSKKHPVHVLPCENFHRIPLGELKASPMLTNLHREFLGRIFPMKQCGAYNDVKCHFAKHHNTAVYLANTGLWDLLFKI